MQRNSNLAYNYSMFEEKPKVKPEIKKVAKRKVKQKLASVPKTIACLLVASLCLSMLLYGHVAKAELDNTQSKTLAQLKSLKDEQVHLEIQLEQKMSLKKIEDIATEELGLVKLGKERIEYISIENENKAKVIKKQGFFDTIKNWVASLFE